MRHWTETRHQQNNHPWWLDAVFGVIAGAFICTIGGAVLLLALIVR